MNRIVIEIKNVYGKEVAYPVCTQAHLFCRLLSTKTLTAQAISTIEQLGFEVLTKEVYDSFILKKLPARTAPHLKLIHTIVEG
jgi:hypothetical protein